MAAEKPSTTAPPEFIHMKKESTPPKTKQKAMNEAQLLELLKKVGNLPKEQLVRAHTLAEEHVQAVKLARSAVKTSEQAVLPRAALVEVRAA